MNTQTTNTQETAQVEQTLTLNDFVFNLAPTHSNPEIFILLDMEGIKYSEKSVRWYAAKARSGVRR